MRTLALAYRDWRRAVLALRMIVAGAFLILVALDAVAEFVPQSLWGQNLTGQALDLADDAIWAMLLTPIVVAVHRFVIQDVVALGYTAATGRLPRRARRQTRACSPSFHSAIQSTRRSSPGCSR
jgi:multisubunit Na+/H+ antiporter MnhC subunit